MFLVNYKVDCIFFYLFMFYLIILIYSNIIIGKICFYGCILGEENS